MIFTKESEKEFEKAKNFRICGLSLKNTDGVVDKVRDHCHFTGKYRGAAHKLCNLQFKKPIAKFTPVIFHNLTNYDCHLFINNLGKRDGVIKCIPNNKEKYITFSKEIEVGSYTNKEGKHVSIKPKIRFIDSFKFMASSLDNPVNNLDHSNLKHTRKEFEESYRFTVKKRCLSL